MPYLIGVALNEKYKRLQSVGDKLAEIESLIDWKPFRPILESMYNNRCDKKLHYELLYSYPFHSG